VERLAFNNFGVVERELSVIRLSFVWNGEIEYMNIRDPDRTDGNNRCHA